MGRASMDSFFSTMIRARRQHAGGSLLIVQQLLRKLEQLSSQPADEDPGGNAADKDQNTGTSDHVRSPEKEAEGYGHGD